MMQKNNSGANPSKPKPSSGSFNSRSTTNLKSGRQAEALVTEEGSTETFRVTSEIRECFSRMAEVMAKQRANDKEK
jgi:hypothetical protein